MVSESDGDTDYALVWGKLPSIDVKISTRDNLNFVACGELRHSLYPSDPIEFSSWLWCSHHIVLLLRVERRKR